MKNLVQWLNANKISMNVQKSEIVIFNLQREKLDSDIKITLSRKNSIPHILLKILQNPALKLTKI